MIKVTIKDDDGKVIRSMVCPVDAVVQEPKLAPKKKEAISLMGLVGIGIKNLIVNQIKDKYFGGLL